MNYFRIKNWDEFQHYKDRNPPWIKLHRALIDDYEFSRLPDVSKAHLMMMWLFASQNGGRIPDDPKFLQEKLSLDKQPGLQDLVDQGFLIPEQDDSTSLAERKQDASTSLAFARSREKRREEAEENIRRFGLFWSAYPKRVAKPDALKAWKRLEHSFEDFEVLMSALERWKKSEQWARDDGKFIPHAATWLKREGWKDEVAAAPAALGAAVLDMGACPCGKPATVKVGGKPRCEEHVRGMEAAA